MASVTKSDEHAATSEDLGQQVIGRFSIFLLIIVLLVAGVSYYEGMTTFPSYQDAEGVNIANAWSMLNPDHPSFEYSENLNTASDPNAEEEQTNLSRLSPYTYAYEEAPTSTFILAGWTALLGGFDQFGFPLNTGRVLMLIFHLLSVALVFSTTKKVSNNDLAALIAALLFALSPLALSIQRRVLADNIMLFFLLTSFYLIVGKEPNLYSYMASAMFFGTAVLTKSTAFIFLPGFLYIVNMTAHPHLRRFAVNLWMTFSIFLMSLFPLYAQMRQELFPEGWILGGDFPHVSLVERFLDRGPDTGVFLNIGSGVAGAFAEWTDLTNITADPVLIFGGAIAVIFLAVMAGDNRDLRPVAVAALVFSIGAFLAGRIVISDIISLLPFFAMSLGIVVAVAAHLVSGVVSGFLKPFIMGGAVLVLLYPFWIFYSARIELYTLDQVEDQITAVQWVEDHVPGDAIIITDAYAFVALREAGFLNTHHYWKVDTDPDVKFPLLRDDHCEIDYIITTPQVIGDIDLYQLDLVRRALVNSRVLQTYDNNGWTIEVRQVTRTNCNPIPDGISSDDATTTSGAGDTTSGAGDTTSDSQSSTGSAPLSLDGD